MSKKNNNTPLKNAMQRMGHIGLDIIYVLCGWPLLGNRELNKNTFNLCEVNLPLRSTAEVGEEQDCRDVYG